MGSEIDVLNLQRGQATCNDTHFVAKGRGFIVARPVMLQPKTVGEVWQVSSLEWFPNTVYLTFQTPSRLECW